VIFPGLDYVAIPYDSLFRSAKAATELSAENELLAVPALLTSAAAIESYCIGLPSYIEGLEARQRAGRVQDGVDPPWPPVGYSGPAPAKPNPALLRAAVRFRERDPLIKRVRRFITDLSGIESQECDDLPWYRALKVLF
jgi:hypothetical protein